MDCQSCQNKIDDFIRDRLDIRTSAEFSEHIKTCASCYNELEINYCLQAAIAELHDEATETSADYTLKLKNKLAASIESYRKQRRSRHIKRAAVIIALIAIGASIGLYS